MRDLRADRFVVLLRPAFLEADNVGGRVGDGELPTYLGETLIAVFGEVLETPTVEGQDTN